MVTFNQLHYDYIYNLTVNPDTTPILSPDELLSIYGEQYNLTKKSIDSNMVVESSNDIPNVDLAKDENSNITA